MSNDVSVRELRNHTADVLRRVEAGERLRVTVDRRYTQDSDFDDLAVDVVRV